jgi:hypothetical protein
MSLPCSLSVLWSDWVARKDPLLPATQEQPSNDWRISCRPSRPRPHKPTFRSALGEGAARAGSAPVRPVGCMRGLGGAPREFNRKNRSAHPGQRHYTGRTSFRNGNMCSYRIQGMPDSIATAARESMTSPQYGHPVHAEMATGYGPCRLCLHQLRTPVTYHLRCSTRPSGAAVSMAASTGRYSGKMTRDGLTAGRPVSAGIQQ